LVRFDGQGNFISATNSTVTVQRAHEASAKPTAFNIDFSKVSGLAATTSSLSASNQDGFPPGELTSYNIGTDGTISGVFSNGTQRNLGQLQIATFANNQGLEQQGNNLFAAGVNSGLPVSGSPGANGAGSIVAGAVELSNVDIGKSLISLISASTEYEGNSRVITTANQLFQTLLQIGR
jgi:flagellar hook protein FlgE